MDSVNPNSPEEPGADGPLIRTHINVRSLSLAVLAVLACVVVLRWAADVFVPLLIGVMLSYALSPLVDWLVRRRIPCAFAAALVMMTVIGSVAGIGVVLKDDVMTMIDGLPDTVRKLGRAVSVPKGGSKHPLTKVEEAAAEVERATQQSSTAGTPRGVTRVQVEPERIRLRERLWVGTLGLVTLVGQAVVVCFIAFFMLASGNTFRRKLVKIAGPTFARRRITVEMLDEITSLIQRYLLVQVFTSVLVGIVTWLVFLWIGLEHAAVWGVLACVLNMIPYLGAVVVTAGAGLVGFVQFGSLDMALLVAGSSFVIQSIEGYLLTPWLTSRAIRMSPVVVFVGVLAFGWLWGVWGLLLGVPVLMVIKAVCERVDDLRPLAELLGD